VRTCAVLLYIEPVLQAQWTKIVFGQLAGQKTPRLVAELRYPFRHNALVYVVVSIHKYLFLNNIYINFACRSHKFGLR
jgi:hypothetical protein